MRLRCLASRARSETALCLVAHVLLVPVIEGCVVRRATRYFLCGVLLLLTGCTAHAATPKAPAAAAATSSKPTTSIAPLGEPPLVGSCVTIDPARTSNALSAPASGDCAHPHNAEVIFVLNTALSTLTHYPTARDVADPQGPVGQNLHDVCNHAMLYRYLNGGDEGPGAYGGDVFAESASFVPSPQQWSAGARWVECDAFYGISAPQTAPGRLAGALRREDSAAYRLCFVGQPIAFDFTPCSSGHDAEFVDVIEAPTGTSYPESLSARRLVAQDCSPSAVSYVGGRMPAGYTTDVYLPDRAAWDQHPFAYCVLVRLDRMSSATSLHA